MKYIYKSKSKNIFVLTVPALIFSFLIAIIPYAFGNYKMYGVAPSYLLFCFVFWSISLMLIHFESEYILRKDAQLNSNKKQTYILIITAIIITALTIIFTLAGYILVLFSYSSTATTIIEYLLPLVIVLPAIQYFSIFLYFLGRRMMLIMFLVPNSIIIGGGLIWVVIDLLSS